MAPLDYVTDFADQAVMLPIALVVGLAMAFAGWRRGALAWGAAIGGMLATMLVLKLWAGTCGPQLFGDQMQSPSGHTASAAAIYGGALALLLRRAWPGLPAALPCAAALALVVGTTRVLLGAHSVPEVLVGGLVGIAAAMALVALAGPVPPRLRFRPVPVAGAILGVLVIFHGLHMPAEAAIRKVRITWLPFGLCRAQS